jgi:hypothetical protein
MKMLWTVVAVGLALSGPAAAQTQRLPTLDSPTAPISPTPATQPAPLCSGHGRVVSGLCACAPGWSGLSCQAPLGLICDGHGVEESGRCVCTTYWMGPTCSIPGLSLTGRLIKP